ncbi:DivIVA domain-containing protein, partial [Escherichia coli]
MALSPEDVLNKTFTTTQFRRGYDEREVDDFLDDIVAEMRRMTKTDDEVRKQLNDCRQGRGLEPVTAAMPAAAAVVPDRSAEISKLEGRNSELEARVRELEELEGKSQVDENEGAAD